jgi:hypothetical protein
MAVDGYFTKYWWPDINYYWPDVNGYWTEAGQVAVAVQTRFEARLFSRLTADANIVTLASTRIYPQYLVQKSSLPAITYSMGGGNLVFDLSGYSTLENPLAVINVYATSYGGVKNLANKVVTCVENASQFSAILKQDMDGYDDETEIYNVQLQFSAWHQT